MNFVKGLLAFKSRKGLTNQEIAEILGCSVSVVSLYCSGKSGISLEKLELLIQHGMTIDEAFSPETARAIREQIGGISPLKTPVKPGLGGGLTGVKTDFEIVKNGLAILLSRVNGESPTGAGESPGIGES